MRVSTPCLIVLALLAVAGCGDEPRTPAAVDAMAARPVIERYAEIVSANYQEVLFWIAKLNFEVIQTVGTAEAGLDRARAAWIEARAVYGPSEAFRFYGGPIDHPETGVEGLVNAWPLDEAYVDYVEGNPGAGIINDPETHPEITAELLESLNEKGGEENVATGWHAIEFLLWGQDLSADGPGTRSPLDYTDRPNAARRLVYLKVVCELLTKHMLQVKRAWSGDGGEAWRRLDHKDALTKMFTGICMLAEDELAGERMNVAWETKDQENEHSCFSDNTLADLRGNLEGIENVYLGRYKDTDGPGLDELVVGVDPDLDGKMKQQLDACRAAMKAIPAPFDRAIVSAEGRPKLKAAIEAMHELAALLVKGAESLGLTINLEAGE